jgi:hypothetical protein
MREKVWASARLQALQQRHDSKTPQFYWTGWQIALQPNLCRAFHSLHQHIQF